MGLKFLGGVIFEGACCGLIAGILYFIFSQNLYALPFGTLYGVAIALPIGFIIK